MARQDDLVKAMTLEDHVNLATNFVAIQYGAGDAKTDRHEFDCNDANLPILDAAWVVLVDLDEEL